MSDQRRDSRSMSTVRPHPEELSLSALFDVVPTAEGAQAVRAAVRDVLTQWAVDVAAANAAVDVANELVANAVQHGLPPVTLMLRCTATTVQVAVSDGSREPVRRLPYRSGVSERGLGLRLIGQLSREWGQQDHGQGKLVWATVSRRSRAR